jgi:hypothetical protein
MRAFAHLVPLHFLQREARAAVARRRFPPA